MRWVLILLLCAGLLSSCVPAPESAAPPPPDVTPPSAQSPNPSPSPTQEPAQKAALSPEASPQPWAIFLGRTVREDYIYIIEWEPYVFDPARPLELLRITPMPERDRARMERLIYLFASLYPPDYFNARVERILCYRSFSAARLDENDQPVLDEGGDLLWDAYTGATGEGHIIITDNFSGDYDILRALAHEFAHVQQWHEGEELLAWQEYQERVRAQNPEGFVYYYEQEGIESTADIPNWRSTDGAADWELGFARRYAMLSMEEEHAALMEKIQLGRMSEFAKYPALYAKMEAAAALIGSGHPSLTSEFYLEELPAYVEQALR